MTRLAIATIMSTSISMSTGEAGKLKAQLQAIRDLVVHAITNERQLRQIKAVNPVHGHDDLYQLEKAPLDQLPWHTADEGVFPPDAPLEVVRAYPYWNLCEIVTITVRDAVRKAIKAEGATAEWVLFRPKSIITLTTTSTARNPSHSVLRITDKNGEHHIMDLTQPQYGYDENNWFTGEPEYRDRFVRDGGAHMPVMAMMEKFFEDNVDSGFPSAQKTSLREFENDWQKCRDLGGLADLASDQSITIC